MNVNEARPRTDRERSFGQDGHPGRSGYGGGKRYQEDHRVAPPSWVVLPLQVELYWSPLEPKISPDNSRLKKKGK